MPEVKCHITKLDSYSSDTGETVPIDHFKNQVTLEGKTIPTIVVHYWNVGLASSDMLLY